MQVLPPDANLNQFPPEPRAVRWRPVVLRTRRAIAALALLVAVLLGPYLWNRHVRFVELCLHGSKTTAVVTSKRASGDRNVDYLVDYRGTTLRGQFEGTEKLDLAEWDRVNIGDRIEVAYAPDDLSNNRARPPRPEDVKDSENGLLAWGAAYLVGLLIVVLGYENSVRNEWRLASEGTAFLAQTRVIEVRTRDNDVIKLTNQLEYSFKDASEEPKTTKTGNLTFAQTELLLKNNHTVVLAAPGFDEKPWPLFRYVDILDA